MNKTSNIFRLICVCVLGAQALDAYSSERLLDASISARAEYNDNLFLVDDPSPISSIFVTPSLSGIIRERHWEAKIDAKLGIKKYSESDLDSNDQFFSLSSRYQSDRNAYSLNIGHDLVSNLSSSSDDFGLARKRIKRKSQSIAPSYTRLLTERSTLNLSYIYTDVDYLDAENTNFTPYITHTGILSLQYKLTERDDLTLSMRAVDYESKDKSITYQLLISNIGINHTFSETLISNFQIGVSRRSTTSLRTEIIDFPGGGVITVPREVDAQNRGLVFNIGLTQLLESGSVNANINRNDTTNSFGGLDVSNALTLTYNKRISELWQYDVNGSFRNTESTSSGSFITDRDTLIFKGIAKYSINRGWSLRASYQYTARQFKSDVREGRAPHSNMVYVSLSYIFLPLSTF